MKLVLPIAEEWETSERDGRLVAVVPGHEGEPDLLVEVSEVQPLPPVVDPAWVQKQLSVNLPPNASLQIQGSADDKSANGWPVTLFRSAVADAGGTLVEQRISVFYRLLNNFAIAELRGMNAERWNQLSNQLGQIVMGGQLDWSGAPCSLAEIYGFGPDHPIFGEPPPEPTPGS